MVPSEKRYIKKNISGISKNPIFAEEIQNTQRIIKEHPNAKAPSGEKLFNDDIFFAEITEKSEDKDSVATHIYVDGFAYREERVVLNSLIDKLFENNRSDFKNKDEIFEIFAKGMMTGNILPLGKLIDHIFGNGIFRRIGELGDNVNELKELVDSL